jgi:hypothetical protein
MVLAFVVAAVGIPIALIYRRNRAPRGSPRITYARAVIHYMKFAAWGLMVVSFVFLVPITTDLMGFSRFGYPSWAIVLPPVAFLLGFGLRRLAVFVLEDDLLWRFNQPPK